MQLTRVQDGSSRYPQLIEQPFNGRFRTSGLMTRETPDKQGMAPCSRR